MVVLRKILFPFAFLYGCITSLRNFLYNKGILKSYSFDVPVIAVGNLSVGGTGKTPQIEYLIRLLSVQYSIATLSRGYKRQSKGFVLADAHSTTQTLGDEPFQFFTKFPNIQVAVDANRKNGIEQLLAQPQKPQIILLDDAFQHRRVKAGFYILLTAYDDLFCDDFMLPTGNLREYRRGAQRADMIVVTKCPSTISESEQEKIQQKIQQYTTAQTPVFFTYIAYEDYFYSAKGRALTTENQFVDKLVVAGIAKPEPFFAYLQAEKNATLAFPDHHEFSEKELQDILELAQQRTIVTTEKDYMRLQGKLPEAQLYYLPIQSSFVKNSNEFDKKILTYVGTSTRNR